MKLLIAGTYEAMTQSLIAQLHPLYEIYTIKDGKETIALLQDLRPDILILDLHIHNTDGFSVLRNARYKPPVTIALTTLVTDDVLSSAAELGVNQIFPLPCSTKVIADYIKETTPSLV